MKYFPFLFFRRQISRKINSLISRHHAASYFTISSFSCTTFSCTSDLIITMPTDEIKLRWKQRRSFVVSERFHAAPKHDWWSRRHFYLFLAKKAGNSFWHFRTDLLKVNIGYSFSSTCHKSIRMYNWRAMT